MPPYPGTAMETAIARGGGPSRLEVARAPLNGPGGPQAGSLRFPGGFVCEKMRESQTACKELVNTRRADLRLGGRGGAGYCSWSCVYCRKAQLVARSGISPFPACTDGDLLQK